MSIILDWSMVIHLKRHSTNYMTKHGNEDSIGMPISYRHSSHPTKHALIKRLAEFQNLAHAK